MSQIAISPARAIGATDRKLFGGFVEHLGHCIYGGLFEEGSDRSDERGFRQDVLALLRELRPGVLRWPGGNFVSNYHWRDGVGPRDARPRRPELAWGGEEQLGPGHGLGSAPALERPGRAVPGQVLGLGNEMYGEWQVGQLTAEEYVREATRWARDAEDPLPPVAYNGLARLGPRAPVRPGDRVTFRLDPSLLHFFDPGTGAAVG